MALVLGCSQVEVLCFPCSLQTLLVRDHQPILQMGRLRLRKVKHLVSACHSWFKVKSLPGTQTPLLVL